MWPANFVWVPRVTAAEIAAGTGQDVRLWAVVDVKSMIDTWAPLAPGVLVNPMTTRGDMIYASASGTPATAARRGIGSANTVLSSDGADPVYATIAAILASLLTTAGDRVVRNGSGAVVRLPVGSVALGAGTDIDFAAGDVFTKTISGSTTFTASNETWGWPTVLLILAVSGSPAEPTWPGTTTKVGTGTWSTSATNYVFLTRTGSGTFIRTVGQAS